METRPREKRMAIGVSCASEEAGKGRQGEAKSSGPRQKKGKDVHQEKVGMTKMGLCG